MDTRRRLPRQPADWPGSYCFVDDPDIAAGACRVVDISRMGSGIELYGDTPLDPLHHRLVIDIADSSDGSVGLRIEGEVRNITLGNSGGVRLGIEFGGLSADEQAILRSLEEMRLAW